MWKIKRRKNPDLTVKWPKFHSMPSSGQLHLKSAGWRQDRWTLIGSTIGHRKLAQLPQPSMGFVILVERRGRGTAERDGGQIVRSFCVWVGYQTSQWWSRGTSFKWTFLWSKWEDATLFSERPGWRRSGRSSGMFKRLMMAFQCQGDKWLLPACAPPPLKQPAGGGCRRSSRGVAGELP